MFHRSLLLLTLVAALAFTAPAASAGTYTVSYCQPGGGDLATWPVVKSGSWSVKSDCPRGVTIYPANTTGRWAGLRTPALPTGVGLTRVSLIAQGLRSATARPEVRFCTNPAGKCNAKQTRRAAKHSNRAHAADYVWHPTKNRPSASGFEFRVYSYAGKSVKTKSYLKLNTLNLTLLDSVSPTVSASPSFDPAAWNTGVVSLTTTASDAQSGVKSVELAVDGSKQLAKQPSSCTYSSPTPCPPSVTNQFTINTADLTEGQHTAIVTATDAGGDTTTTNVTFSSDNTPPARIGSINWGGSHCGPVSPSWTFSDDGAGSPITSVRVVYARFNKAYDEDWNETFSTGEDVVLNLPFGTTEEYGEVSPASIGSLRLPASSNQQENTYLVSISLVDAAGNVGPARVTSIDSWSCDS